MENRIRAIMEREHMTQQEFAQKLELSPATLSNIFNGRTRPTNNHVQAIHKAFPKININWVLFGEGGMYDGAEGGTDDVAAYPSAGDAPSADAVPTFGGAAPIYNNEAAPGAAQPDGEATLFSVPPLQPAAPTARRPLSSAAERPASVPREATLDLAAAHVKIIDNRPRRIKEIRVFYDDGTYEAFVPSK